MKFVKTTPDEAQDAIANNINRALAEGSVLLLLSGGSNIELAVQIRKQLILNHQLTVGLIDERYGTEGHIDSNWAKLTSAGFDTSNITIMPVLHDETFEQTTKNYEVMLSNAIENHKTIVGIFGMGEDGHTSGILPGSPAVNAAEIVTHYQGDDFKRITTTPVAFKFFHKAYLVAFGENKREQLKRLKQDIPISEQPAQSLKQIPEFIIYSDMETSNG